MARRLRSKRFEAVQGSPLRRSLAGTMFLVVLLMTFSVIFTLENVLNLILELVTELLQGVHDASYVRKRVGDIWGT